MRGWEARARGVSTTKRRNTGCAFCGKPPTRTLWLFGAGRVNVCDACAAKKMAEAKGAA